MTGNVPPTQSIKVKSDTTHGERQKQIANSGDKCEDMTIMTWNVMGTTTVLHEIQTLAQKYKPWVIVLTETKLTDLPQDRKLIEPYLPEYKLYHSRSKGRDTNAYRTGSGGVTVAIHESLTSQNSVKLVDIDDPAAKSHCKTVSISPPGSTTITIWGLYLPCNKIEKRRQICELIHKGMTTIDEEACRLGQNPLYHIIAGDMNAALYPDDKQGYGEESDMIHRKLICNLKLHTTDKRQGTTRQFTFRSKHSSDQDSRIDDIFTSANLQNEHTSTTIISSTTGDSDHDPILAHIPLTCKGFCKPGPDPRPLPVAPKLKTPIPPENLRNFQLKFELEMATHITILNEELDSALALAQLHVNKDKPTARPKASHEARSTAEASEAVHEAYMKRLEDTLVLNQSLKSSLTEIGLDAECIERLNMSLQHILQHIIPISMQTMSYTAGGTTQLRYRSRTTNRRISALAKTRKALYQVIKLHRNSKARGRTGRTVRSKTVPTDHTSHPADTPKQPCCLFEIQKLLQSIPAHHQQQLQGLTHPEPNNSSNQDWQDWEANLLVQRKRMQKHKDTIVKAVRQKTANAKRKHAQRAYVHNPKK